MFFFFLFLGKLFSFFHTSHFAPAIDFLDSKFHFSEEGHQNYQGVDTPVDVEEIDDERASLLKCISLVGHAIQYHD